MWEVYRAPREFVAHLEHKRFWVFFRASSNFVALGFTAGSMVNELDFYVELHLVFFTFKVAINAT